MPGMDGIDVLRTVKEVSPETVVIMITAYATAETAVEAMKLGAYDYITKPFKVDEIKLVISKGLEKRLLRKENILLKREMESRLGFKNFIGNSEPMQKVFMLIRQVADTASTVLDHGRERNRQRIGRESGSLQQFEERKTFCDGQLRSFAGNPSGKRIVRVHEGRVYGPFPTNKVCSRQPTAALFSWTKSALRHRHCRSNCCGFCRNGNSCGWAELRTSKWTYGSLPQAIRTCFQK